MIKKLYSKSAAKTLAWLLVGLVGAGSFSGIALIRGENISSLWILTAFICTQLIAYRFYGAFIALKILHIDGRRATPATKINDGQDFVPTNKWIVFGHHFAAIAGPGPLIGPTLAAQFGFLPGTLWILIGSVFAGAVQDMVILFASVRRDGKSLGRMIKDELGQTAGYAAMIGTLAIILILISVLGLIVVKALMHSPWGSFTVLMTVPIAMLIGFYLYYIRPSGVLEASLIGIVLFLLAVAGGEYVQKSALLGSIFSRDAKFLAWSLIFYGFLAAILPVWLLLTPRDYLSSFLKLGVIFLLAIAIFIFRPEIQMPAITQFIDGTGPVFKGKVFPFLFITIACGAISGFHALVASGTTPKLIANEREIPMIGYGSMLLEAFVAIMAMIAATTMKPGIFFAINSPVFISEVHTAQMITNAGFPVTKAEMDLLSTQVGEAGLFSRTGGAPSLAIGMATIFANAFNKVSSNMMALWYHFAIMFEAVFILTTLDAGTRVARFMLEDLLGFRNKKLHESTIAMIFSSAFVVAIWGYFLYIGAIDPNGGVNMFWPLFGMSNQMLAGIALTLATVIILKSEKPKYFFITAIPLVFVLLTTTWSVVEKVFSSNPEIGFLASAFYLDAMSERAICNQDWYELAQTMSFNKKLVSFMAIGFAVILWTVVFSSLKNFFSQKNARKKH
jgi:carbon starvation protein